MSNESDMKNRKDQQRYIHKIEGAAKRKLANQKNPNQVWFGLGMMGLIGWSIVVPTLLGAMFGVWLDKRANGAISWTLTLLIVGLAIGCLNAWRWVDKERKEMSPDEETKYE